MTDARLPGEAIPSTPMRRASSSLCAVSGVTSRRADPVAVCWASEGNHIIVGTVASLAETSDGTLWHDHSPNNGDIVCTGPFTLSVASTVVGEATP